MKKIIVISLLFAVKIISNGLIFAQTINWHKPNPNAGLSGYGESSNCQIDLHCNSFSLSQDTTENLGRSSVIFEIKNSDPSSSNIYHTSTCSATILAKQDNGNLNPEYYILTARHCLHEDKFSL